MTGVLPESHRRAAVELVGYFTGAFGNEVRIDYGTGRYLGPSRLPSSNRPLLIPC